MYAHWDGNIKDKTKKKQHTHTHESTHSGRKEGHKKQVAIRYHIKRSDYHRLERWALESDVCDTRAHSTLDEQWNAIKCWNVIVLKCFAGVGDAMQHTHAHKQTYKHPMNRGGLGWPIADGIPWGNYFQRYVLFFTLALYSIKCIKNVLTEEKKTRTVQIEILHSRMVCVCAVVITAVNASTSTAAGESFSLLRKTNRQRKSNKVGMRHAFTQHSTTICSHTIFDYK